jgi:hypothetical protein
MEAIMRPLPASDVSTVAILLILGYELLGGLLYGFVVAFIVRRRERTRPPDPRGGLRVLPLATRHTHDARKAA